MSSLEKTQSAEVKTTNSGTEKKLFYYYMKKNTENYNNQRLFFYRCNRWRFSTKDAVRANKGLRLKTPAYFVIGALLLIDFSFGHYRLSAAH